MIKRNPLPKPIVEIAWMQKLHQYMEEQGYVRVLESTSAFDTHPTVIALSDYGGEAERCNYLIGQEFDAYDKECNIRCHIVVEQDLNGEYKLVHCHVEPLDPTKPVKGPTNQPKVPYEVDHETDGHIILRHVDPPHRRLVVPKQKELSLSLLKALWRQAQLNVQEFGELLIWCWNKHG